MIFADRAEAGRRLAVAVAPEIPSRATLVLGIARGGVIVARALADALGLPCGVVVVRKVGAPWNPELALGAVADGVRVIDDEALVATGASVDAIEAIVAREQREVERREAAYRRGGTPPDLSGMTALLVDDGLATGATAVAAVRWARAHGAVRVVVAVPVGARASVRRVRREADSVVVLEEPREFRAVGEWYEHFGQATDADVTAALGEAA